MARSLLLLILLILSVSPSISGYGGSDDDARAEAPSTKAQDLRSRSLILFKIWCIILVFIGTFVGGVSPYFLKWNEGFLVVGTQFVGGMFPITALMHFLSDSNETFRDLTEKAYSLAFMLTNTFLQRQNPLRLVGWVIFSHDDYDLWWPTFGGTILCSLFLLISFKPNSFVLDSTTVYAVGVGFFSYMMLMIFGGPLLEEQYIAAFSS